MGRKRETVQTTATSSSTSGTSSHRETAGTDHIQKTVGCMTGLFHFFSRHHQSHSRKRLTSAKKKEKIVLPPPKSSPSTEETSPASRTIDDAANKKRVNSRRKSCETPRSPTIAQEIRRQSSSSVESPARQRGLVARLMGLEDSSPSPGTSPMETAAEKRRKLLGALEKCDEDLRTLRRIIEAVRLAEVKTKAVVSAVESAQSAESNVRKEAKAEAGGGEPPRPVSVFDAISSPRYRSKRHDNGGSDITAVGSKIVKPSRMGVLFSGENCKKSKDGDGDGDQIEERTGSMCQKVQDVDGMLPPRVYELKELITRRLTSERCRQRGWWWQTKRSLSQALVENVGEVWEEGVWEERWEMGRVAVEMAGDVVWDLVEEAVVDLVACCSKLSSARRRACKKRLQF